MKKLGLKNVKSYRFTNALHLQFTLEILVLLTKFDWLKLKLIDLFDIFKVCIEQEESCYKIVHKSNLSNLKQESDYARDTIIVGIKHMLKAGIRHFDKEIREAAQRLKIVFDTYDKPVLLIKLPYDAETAAINKLLNELNAKYTDDLQKTGITSWAVELQAKNEEFDHLVKSYHDEASKKTSIRLADARKETDKIYQELVIFINSLIVVDKGNSYEQFVTEFNTLVKHYNDLLAQHIGRIHAGEEKTNK
jgi:Skp family chaperone for outer membrane proteins